MKRICLFLVVLCIMGLLSCTKENPPIVKFTFEVSAGPGGTANPLGKTEVAQGDTLTISITSYSGFEVDIVKIDGNIVPTKLYYSFGSIDSNHKLEVIFKKIPEILFTVEVLPCEGGSVGPYSTIRVTSGLSLNFTLTPEFGFKPDSIIVNGLSIPLTGNTFSLTNITSDTKIKGVFVKIQSWYLIQKPWKWFKWEARTVNTVDWWNQILPRDEIFIFNDQYKFQEFFPPQLVGDGLYILKQDSLIIGPNTQTLKDGIRNKIILLTADTLKLVFISKFYEFPSGRPVPERNVETRNTYVH